MTAVTPVRTGPSIARHKSKQDYRTPNNFMAAVRGNFGPISFDLAADHTNHQADGFFNLAENSLVQEWHKIPGWLWLNPPFSDIAPWAKKCAEESMLGARILFLTPASIGADWFADYVHDRAMVLALNGRLSFDGVSPYPKDCMLSVYAHRLSGFDVWNWKA